MDVISKRDDFNVFQELFVYACMLKSAHNKEDPADPVKVDAVWITQRIITYAWPPKTKLANEDKAEAQRHNKPSESKTFEDALRSSLEMLRGENKSRKQKQILMRQHNPPHCCTKDNSNAQNWGCKAESPWLVCAD